MNPKIFKDTAPFLQGTALDVGYCRFISHFGIDGLAKEKGHELYLLAVHAEEIGKGQFRAFMQAAKSEYRTIFVLDIVNKDMKKILTKYGFRVTEVYDEDAKEVVEGMRWDL